MLQDCPGMTSRPFCMELREQTVISCMLICYNSCTSLSTCEMLGLQHLKFLTASVARWWVQRSTGRALARTTPAVCRVKHTRAAHLIAGTGLLRSGHAEDTVLTSTRCRWRYGLSVSQACAAGAVREAARAATVTAGVAAGCFSGGRHVHRGGALHWLADFAGVQEQHPL